MSLNDASLWAVVIGGGIAFFGAMYAAAKWVWPKWKQLRRQSTAAFDSLVGREAINDPITGRELAPALPGIGQRMATVEDSVKQIAAAMASLNDAHHRIDQVEETQDALKHRVKSLERAQMERIATRAENAAAMSMIDRLHSQRDQNPDEG